MGYTRVVQYGDVTEVYEYEKEFHKPRHVRRQSRLQKKRRHDQKPLPRTLRSIKRARDSFFRLVHHNNKFAKSITFATLTFADDYSYASNIRSLSKFFAKLRKNVPSFQNSPVSYIGVPERTKKNRIHFHLLIYNLPPSTVQNERTTRYIQRLYGRGYLDLRLAENSSPKIAGYMAKYLAKYLSHPDLETRRAYNCSRNIEKITTYGSNSFSQYEDLIIDKNTFTKSASYDTMYLGRCIKSQYKNSYV